jgi:hypothetical protein
MFEGVKQDIGPSKLSLLLGLQLKDERLFPIAPERVSFGQQLLDRA